MYCDVDVDVDVELRCDSDSDCEQHCYYGCCDCVKETNKKMMKRLLLQKISLFEAAISVV